MEFNILYVNFTKSSNIFLIIMFGSFPKNVSFEEADIFLKCIINTYEYYNIVISLT